ncbi:MAG: methionyl-tRNA formyltransferase [Chlamydiia bacterium]|nr:methionyl-tRNA formyltransferase [Chlamydiia bacterium]
MQLLLVGSTDLTLSIAQHLQRINYPPAACVYAPQEFRISYAPSGVRNCRFGAISDWCTDTGCPSYEFSSNQEWKAWLKSQSFDLAIVAGWYHMVPRSIRDCFPLGCIGLHASLLPDLRGGAPLNWALLSGRTETGISLFQLSDGVDDGFLYGQHRFPIGPRSTIQELVDAAQQGALQLLSESLPQLAEGRLQPYPQEGKPSYCQQRCPGDSLIDWHQPATLTDRLIRAVSEPYGGAFSFLQGSRLTIWEATPFDEIEVIGMPGQIALIPQVSLPLVCTGSGVLQIKRVTDENGQSALPLLMKANHKRLGA